jgi:hypothetical protein
MIAPVAKLIEWASVQVIFTKMPHPDGDLGLDEAIQFLNQTPVNLTLLQPAIPRKNILLIEAIHDLRAPKEDIERLWQAWVQPDIWRLPHGHISLMSQRGLTERVLDWLTPWMIGPSGQRNQTMADPTIEHWCPDGTLFPCRKPLSVPQRERALP